MHRRQETAISAHPDENQIVDVLAGTASAGELHSLRDHLLQCTSCASLFDVLTDDRVLYAQHDDSAGR